MPTLAPLVPSPAAPPPPMDGPGGDGAPALRPAREAERMAALRRYAVLDTPPEDSFDRFTRLAATIFEMPIALVSLVDDERQWFKSSVGIDVCETARDIAFCNHVVRSGATMVVEDASADPRFADSPLVVGYPGIRFYAGAPLVTPDGLLLGTLCVNDTVPRTFTDAQRRTLEDLADAVMAELELRRESAERQRTVRALTSAKGQLEEVLGSMTEVFLAFDPAWRFIYLNAEAEHRMGRLATEILGKGIWDALPELIGTPLHAAFLRAAAERVTVEFEWDHAFAWDAAVVSRRIKVAPVRYGFAVYITDLTAQREAEAAARQSDGILTAATSAAARFLRAAAWEDEIEPVLAEIGRAAGAGRVYLFESRDAATTTVWRPRYEWAVPSLPAEADPTASIPVVSIGLDRWVRLLRAGAPVAGPLHAFPAAEQGWLAARGARAVAVVPLLIGERWWGLIGFDRVDDERPWSEAELAAFHVVADTLGSAIRRQEAETALRLSEGRLRLAQEAAGVCTWEWDLRTGDTRWGPETWALFEPGGSGTATYVRWLATLHPDDCKRAAATVARALAAGTDYADTYRVVHPGGRVVWIESMGRFDRDAQGPTMLRGAARDISARRAAEAALRASDRRYRDVVDAVRDVVFQSDAEGRMTYLNPAWAEVSGFSVPECLGRGFLDYIHPDDRALNAERFAALAAGVTEGGRYEVRYRTADGGFRWSEVNVRRLLDDAGVVIGTAGTLHDVTERRHAEALLRRANDELEARVAVRTAALEDANVLLEEELVQRRSNEEWISQLHTLLEFARDSIWVLDAEGCSIYWNRSAERLYGRNYPDYGGRDVRDVLGDPDDPELARAFATVLAEGEWAGTLTHRTGGGAAIVVESRWTFVRTKDAAGHDTAGRILVVNTDVTERQELVLRAQRMETLGKLTGGIAHDINNVLGPILMSLQLLARRVPDPKGLQLIGALEAATQRGAGLVRQILAYLRGAQGERAPLAVAPLVDEIGELLREALPRPVALKLVLDDDLWSVCGEATQLHQVLMNLAVNASDAMPDGGDLLIEARNRVVSARDVGADEGRPGPHVLLSVTDTGAGIPPETLAHIFEPFFTTKAKGTGFGLATVLSLVKGHGGFVRVESTPGVGTRFDVFLPALPEEAPAGAPAGGAPARTVPPAHGELVVVVDDNEVLRAAAAEVLEEHGYRVLTGGDGAEGLALVEAQGDAVRAVVTDMMMPGMDGPALIRALHARTPALPVIGMSGLNTREQLRDEGLAVAAFLAKPFSADALLGALHDVIGAEAGGAVPAVPTLPHRDGPRPNDP